MIAMPGISFSGLVLSSEPESMYLGNARFDPWDWDSLQKLDSFIHPTAGRIPLLPIKHKSCRPYKIQAPWLTCKKDLHGKIATPCNSNESENDLATMVHEFIENECNDGNDSSDRESASSDFSSLYERLKALVAPASIAERNLQSLVVGTLLSMCEDSRKLFCEADGECKGGCIRRVVVRRLRNAGYDAGICKSRWQSAGKVPGGEYEYIDVMLRKRSSREEEERIVVDVDFQSQFEIARPIQNYSAALKLLPTLFVGSTNKLNNILDIMSKAAKCSLEQKSMHLPPWRTLHYLCAKWTTTNPSQRQTFSSPSPSFSPSSSNGCSEHIKRIQSSLRLHHVRRRAGSCSS